MTLEFIILLLRCYRYFTCDGIKEEFTDKTTSVTQYNEVK